MRDYLFQPLARAGRDGTPVSAPFASDAPAIQHALSDQFPSGCEVWEGYRLIGRFWGTQRPGPPPRLDGADA